MKLILTALALLICFAAEGASFIPGQYMVKFNSGTTNEQRNIITAHGMTNHIHIPHLDVHVIRGTQGQYNAIRVHPQVAWTEQDQLVHYDFVPNDPSYPSAWHLPKMNCPQAWDITRGSNSVTIAILDSGMDGTHPDLSASMVPGYNFYDNNTNTADTDGHGTAVAGVAAATGNNGIGSSGVSMAAKMMPLRITDTNGFATYSTMATAITYAADHGARVVNLSFGGKDSLTVSNAAQYLSSVGGIIAISSGNQAVFDTAPDNPYELVVGGTDQNDVILSYSALGNNQDLVAPGTSILTTASGGAYGFGSGTSFSAPCVAGVAALIMSIKPSLNAAQIRNYLTANADDLGAPGWDSTYGWGRVNAYRAVSAALGTTTLVCSPIP